MTEGSVSREDIKVSHGGNDHGGSESIVPDLKIIFYLANQSDRSTISWTWKKTFEIKYIATRENTPLDKTESGKFPLTFRNPSEIDKIEVENSKNEVLRLNLGITTTSRGSRLPSVASGSSPFRHFGPLLPLPPRIIYIPYFILF